MPVTTEVIDSKLKLSLQKGINDKGEPVKKAKTFSNVKLEALDEDIYAVADSISKLQKLPLLEVSKVEETILVSQ